MAKARQRISDIAKLEDVRPPAHKFDEYLGLDLNLLAVEYSEGTFGEFAICTVSHVDSTSEQTFTITCGGAIVMKQLARAMENGLPVTICAKKSGRSIYLE